MSGVYQKIQIKKLDPGLPGICKGFEAVSYSFGKMKLMRKYRASCENTRHIGVESHHKYSGTGI